MEPNEPQEMETGGIAVSAIGCGCAVALLGGFAGCTAQFFHDIGYQVSLHGPASPVYILSGIGVGVIFGLLIGYFVNLGRRR